MTRLVAFLACLGALIGCAAGHVVISPVANIALIFGTVVFGLAVLGEETT